MEKKAMEEKKKGPPWGNIVTFVVCALVVWLTVKRYQTISSIAYLYTPEELHQNLDANVLVCIVELIKAGQALWELIAWKLTSDLTKGIWNLFSGLCWVLALLVCEPIYWGIEMKALWLFMLILLLGLGCWDLWKYRKQKLLEETL